MKKSLLEITERNIAQFAPGIEDTKFIKALVSGVEQKLSEIDQTIRQTATEWPLEQINAVDRSILRLGVHELLFSTEVPPKVAINEAVELGKTFGGESSGKFVNGVLGTLYKKLAPSEEAVAAEAETPVVEPASDSKPTE